MIKTRNSLKFMGLLLTVVMLAAMLVAFSLTASAAVTDPPTVDEVIWDLEVIENVSANVTVTDNSVNCTSNYEGFPKAFLLSNDYIAYYMTNGTNTAENPGTVNVSVLGNESVSFSAGMPYSVYLDFSTNDGYIGLENAKLTFVLFDAETGEIKTTVGDVDINKSTDISTTDKMATEILSFTPEADITNCKVGFTLTGSLISNYYLLKVYDLTVVQVHVHAYNEYAYVDEEQCAVVCACGADDPDSEPVAHSFVEGVCENCRSAQSYLLKNGDVETEFISWKALINYVNENVADTDTAKVTLIRDAVSDGDVWISKWIKKNLDIDLAGYKLSNFTASVSGVQVKFTDSSESKTGEILQAGGVYCFTAYDNGTIVIDGIRTDGGFCVNWGGSVIVNDMVSTSGYTDSSIANGSLTVNGGEYGQFILQMNSDKASVSVKDITCTTYDVRDNASLGFTIADTLAEGYTLVDADGNLLNVNRTRIDGNISTQTHTHEYTSLFYNETEHWTACACGVMEDGAVTEAHKGGTATCTAQALCEVCGLSYGILADHTEKTAASCTAQATCSICGESYGEMLDHTEGTPATCTAQAVCSVCGQGYGEPAGHSGGTVSCTEYAKCEKCGGDYGELLPHTGGTATCTSLATCAFCAQPYGELAPHTERTPATCKSLAICDVCEQPYGDYADHTGGTATCIDLAVCEVCGEDYGSLAPHTWGGDETCTVCEAPYPVEVTVTGETVSFPSLDEAFYVINQSGIENAQIKLVDDIISQGQIQVYSGNIVLDLNGYTIPGYSFEIYEANITVKDTSEDESGAFSGYIFLVDSGNLIVESGRIDAGIYLDPRYGMPTVNIKGGKFSDQFHIVSFSGDITVSGGEFAYGIFMIYDRSGHTTQLDVVGGEFINAFFLQSESGEMVLADIIPDASCVKYLDADGNAISADAVASYMYEGYIKVIHKGECEAGGNDSFHWNECTECGVKFDYGAHSGEATCTEKAVCEVCDVEYGMPLPHDYSDGDTCIDCGVGLPIKVIVGEEEFLFDDMTLAMAKAAEYESASIVLQANVINIGEMYVSVYGDVELDLAGYIICNVELSVYGSLTVNDSSEEQSGTISGDYAFCVYGGSLTINGGNIDASSEMEGEEGHDSVITINGGVFTGQYGVDVYDYSELYINGRVFDCTYEEIYLSDADLSTVTVVLSGGEFPNGLEIVDGNVCDVLTDLDCIVYLDENGDVIPVDLTDTEYFEGYIAVGHDAEEWLDICKDEEKHWYECSNCDYASEAVGHDIVVDKAVNATCTATGLTEGKHCTVCSYKVAQEEVSALGHDFGDWISSDDAEGNHWKECACGEKTEVSQHAWNNGEITKESTVTEEGVKTYTCTVCGHTKDESIAKLPPQTDTPPTTGEHNDNDGLSGGAIAGIAVGSTATVGLGGFSLFWFVIKKKKLSDLLTLFKK